MSLGDIVLYLGGAKSGKTRAALAAAEAFEPPRYYLATAEALDDEMRARILAHQAERGPDWCTVEAFGSGRRHRGATVQRPGSGRLPDPLAFKPFRK